MSFSQAQPKKNLIFTIPIRPVVIEPMSDFLVDGRHGFHVTLSPLAAEILGLYLEKFEDVELHHGLFNLERSLEDRSRLEHHKHLERKETSTNQCKLHVKPFKKYITSKNRIQCFMNIILILHMNSLHYTIRDVTA